MSYKEFAREAVVVGLAQVLTAFGNFLLLPLITKSLGTHDYGIWIQILVTVTLLSQIVLLQLQMALLRFLSSKTDKKEIGEEFYTLLSFIALFGFSVAAIIVLIAYEGATFELFGEGDIASSLMVAAFLVPMTAFGSLTTAYFMAVRRFKVYATLIVVLSFGQLFLILFLLTFGLGLMGVVVGALVMSVVVFIIAMTLIIRELGICRPRFTLLKPNLKFSLPLTPSSLIAWVSDSSDRYIVALIMGVSLAGIYSAAYGIASVVFLLINPIQIVLYPTISRLYDNREMTEVKSYLSKSLRYFLMLAIPAVAGMAILAEPLLVALTTPEFVPGAPVIPLVALAGLFYGTLSIVASILYLVKKTHLNMITFAIPAAINVALVFILTPMIGIVGAALSTTIAYALMVMIGTHLSFKYIRFSADLVFIAKSSISAALMVLVIFLIGPSTLIGIILAISIGIIAYFVSLFLLKGMNYEELDMINVVVGAVLSKIFRKRTEPLVEDKENDPNAR